MIRLGFETKVHLNFKEESKLISCYSSSLLVGRWRESVGRRVKGGGACVRRCRSVSSFLGWPLSQAIDASLPSSGRRTDCTDSRKVSSKASHKPATGDLGRQAQLRLLGSGQVLLRTRPWCCFRRRTPRRNDVSTSADTEARGRWALQEFVGKKVRMDSVWSRVI